VRDPRVSIVIPTRNGMATLPAVLDAIAQQRTSLPFEIVAIDSGSTDGTVSLLRRRAQRVLQIDPATFDHGLTRNLAIEHATGDLIVLLVQDATPATDMWLDTLSRAFARDERLAGVFARQIARPDASPLTRLYLNRWVGASDAPRTMEPATASALAALPPSARLERCTFDNVCSCIRRCVWERHPFRSTRFAEDLAWARDVLVAGYRLAYIPEASVIHSHDRSAWYEFQRAYEAHRAMYELFELRTIPTLPALVRAVVSCVRLHARTERTLRAYALALAWPAGQYLGALSARRGWQTRVSRGTV
jgi:rhamnosyltransferase